MRRTLIHILLLALVVTGCDFRPLADMNNVSYVRVYIDEDITNVTGGMSGPAVFPVAVRMVWQVKNAVKIPVIGMGGVTTWKDAVEIMMAGADAVQIGTALFTDPYAPVKITEGLNQYLDDHGMKSVTELTGTVLV